jgi:hypothetical protein
MATTGRCTGAAIAPAARRAERTADGGAYDEDLASKFNGAFEGLLGRSTLTAGEMQTFTTFILQATYPPSRSQPRQLAQSDQQPATISTSARSPTRLRCNGCHVLNPRGLLRQRRADDLRERAADDEGPAQRGRRSACSACRRCVPREHDNAHKGRQVRGFGFLHDGSIDTMERFTPPPSSTPTTQERSWAFILAFDSNMAPIVGQRGR